MKACNFWWVAQTPVAAHSNGNDEFTIYDGEGNYIARASRRESLELICQKHNLCFVEQEKFKTAKD